MPRSDHRLTLTLVVCSIAAGVSSAQAQVTTTYHLHNEASPSPGLKRLRLAGPDAARVALPSVDLQNQAPGSRTVAVFDTPVARGGVIPNGSTVTFTAWLRKTAAAGTVVPQLSLGLNFPITTTLCRATGASALTTTLTAYTVSCTTSSPIVMDASDKFTVSAGFLMTAGPGNQSMRVELHIEGTLNGSADSRVIAPNPLAPVISTLTPDTARAGAMIAVAGGRFGPTQGTSTLKFGGVAASPATWTNTLITVPVPAGAETSAVVVTVGGAASNEALFTLTPSPPAIGAITPAFGKPGDSVLITGTNFGSAQSGPRVTFNGTLAIPTAWSDTTITVVVPPGATSGPAVVTVGGAPSNGFTFTISPSPSITSLAPSTGHFADDVTISGNNFGSSQDTSTVTFNGIEAEVTAWSDSAIATSVPAGATTGPLVVTVANQASNGPTFVVDQGTGTGLLEITSPANGEIVAPGQTVMVTVSSPDNSTFVGVALLAEGQLDVQGNGADTLPAQFPVTIPATIESRKYALTAIGATWAGARATASIEIDVERPDMPTALIPQLRQIIFEAQGEQASIDLSARFPDGSVVSVRESTNVTYTSSDPAVATVDANGIVKAVAEGEADIVATYGPPDTGISATIPVTVPPSLLAAVPPRIDFGNQTIGTASTQQMTISNVSDDELTITSVTAIGDYSETDNCVAASPLAPGASCSISITFGPTEAGSRPGAVGVKSSFHIVPVAFTVTGTGVNQ